MSPWQELRRLSRLTRVFLSAAFVLFTLFAVLRSLPVNSSLPENRDHRLGNHGRTVDNIWNLAKDRAEQPFFEVRNHAIFFDRNPGLFMFAAELFARAGATTPFPNQLFGIALWNIGFALLFLWLLRLFESELVAAAGVGFLLTTPFVLFYSSSIHQEPWSFCFFNLPGYCFVRYLKEGQRRSWFAGTWIAYFLLCQSYWHYYMSAGLLLVALQIREQKFSLRDSALLGLVPVIATLTTFLQVIYALGGVDDALFRMKDIAAARTFDMRIENSRWFPDRTFVGEDDLRRYPLTIRHRLELLSGYRLGTFCGMLFAALVLAGRDAWKRYRFMLLVILAGLSWNLLMIQHTVIHRFAGMFGWFMWVLIVAVFVDELRQLIRPERARLALAALAIPLIGYGLTRDYAPYLRKYVENVRATDDVMRRTSAPLPKQAGER